jgi:hypothetical protein
MHPSCKQTDLVALAAEGFSLLAQGLHLGALGPQPHILGVLSCPQARNLRLNPLLHRINE